MTFQAVAFMRDKVMCIGRMTFFAVNLFHEDMPRAGGCFVPGGSLHGTSDTLSFCESLPATIYKILSLNGIAHKIGGPFWRIENIYTHL
jgi:hypothetical protein